MQPPLSLCMIVKDEDRNLAKCLDSIRALSPEIVIADTGSTDRTIEIARQYGAKVFSLSFERVDFAAARNQTLARATGRWILMLDADETLEPASVPLVQEIIAGNENAGYYFSRRNHASDAEGFTTDHAVRLFPNRPDYRYRGRVHETVDAAILAGGGRLLTSGISIDHNFISSREARRRKNLRYIEILKEEIEADPTDSTRLDFLAAEFHQLEMFAEAALVAEEIARMRPLDASAHLNLGIYRLVYQSDPKRARASFEQALRLRPGYPEALPFLQTAAIPGPNFGSPAAILRTMSNEAGAPHKVFCVKLKREMEGLPEVPFEGHPLGQRIYENVSKQAWGMWVEHMKMLMNEYRLNLGTQQAQEFLLQQMEQYFFGEGSAPPPEFVATTPQN